jgi:hypothetical protein
VRVQVRWANEDPNPLVIQLKKRDAAVALLDAVYDKFEALPPEVRGGPPCVGSLSPRAA